MSEFEETVVVVADDTGRGSLNIVNTFVNAGAIVILFSQSESIDDEAEGFRVSSDSDRLVTVTGNFERVSGVERLRDELLDRFGRIDALMVSTGTRVHTGQRITEMSLNAYWSALAGPLIRNFVVTRTFYPVVADAPTGGHCVFVTESVSEIPQSHAGPQCIAAAAQRMLMRVLLEESGASNSTPRISEICSYTRIESCLDPAESSRDITSIGTVAADIVSSKTGTHGEVVRI